MSEIGPRERVQLRASASAVASEWRCVGVDRRCRESEGKVKIEGYMRVSDEEAHQRRQPPHLDLVTQNLDSVTTHQNTTAATATCPNSEKSLDIPEKISRKFWKILEKI